MQAMLRQHNIKAGIKGENLIINNIKYDMAEALALIQGKMLGDGDQNKNSMNRNLFGFKQDQSVIRKRSREGMEGVLTPSKIQKKGNTIDRFLMNKETRMNSENTEEINSSFTA